MPSQKLSELKELHLARQALIKDRTAAKNREKALTLPLLRRQNETRRRQIESQITAIETAIADRIASDEQLAERCAIPGEHPRHLQNHRLCPSHRNAGTRNPRWKTGCKPGRSGARRPPVRALTGRAFIRGGRASLRQALYMPALVAARFNPRMRDKYSQLIEAGKPAKIAITAIMRKVIVLVNALLREGRR
jgi:transposase